MGKVQNRATAGSAQHYMATTYPDSTIRFVFPNDNILLLYTMLCIHMYHSSKLTLNCKRDTSGRHFNGHMTKMAAIVEIF